jgi:NAD(P)-dependent dehydrogenase (short-subunit alcohol dehydrogenase family)
MDFTGRRVAITGTGRGFGRGLALRLGRLGAELFVSARSVDAAEKVADLIRA